LNSINLNLELLDEDLDGDVAQARESLTSTRQEVSRLAQLVSDFLTYARPSPPKFTELRVVGMLKEVVAFLRPEAQRMGVHLKLNTGTEDGPLQGDAAQLRQVLLNLVLNAVQAVEPLKAERRVVELAARASAGEVALVVHDRGDGIPADEIGQVRQAFHTRRRGGTGLGLAIADRIVTAHGGRIELNNLPESGFEAVVVLPAPAEDGKIGP
jgi:signal transduction histidine kinase